jgi:23S rRNA pseudouridine1911/1915/1917 synthase
MTYGTGADTAGLNRQFLHAFRLEFINPRSGDDLIFEDELPQDLDNVLKELRLSAN